MITLKMIEEATNEVSERSKKERLNYYKKLISEMLDFAIKELDRLKDERQFFIEYYKKDFMVLEIRKAVNELLADINETSYSCLKEINHYRELKEILGQYNI